MVDAFSQYRSGLESPAIRLLNITPSDTADIAEASRALNVATSGTVRMTTVGGTTVTVFIAAGIAFPVRAVRIWSTGTTATDIVALS